MKEIVLISFIETFCRPFVPMTHAPLKASMGFFLQKDGNYIMVVMV